MVINPEGLFFLMPWETGSPHPESARVLDTVARAANIDTGMGVATQSQAGGLCAGRKHEPLSTSTPWLAGPFSAFPLHTLVWRLWLPQASHICCLPFT